MYDHYNKFTSHHPFDLHKPPLQMNPKKLFSFADSNILENKKLLLCTSLRCQSGLISTILNLQNAPPETMSVTETKKIHEHEIKGDGLHDMLSS